MKRTEKETPIEVPGWFRLLMATFCLAAFVGAGRFASTLFDSEGKEDKSKIPEAPAVYLSSSHAFNDVAVFLDGRGRRFEDAPDVAESGLLTASHTVDKEVLKAPEKEDEVLAVQETKEDAAEFVDEPEEGMFADSATSDLSDTFVEPDPDASSFDEFASYDLSNLGWEGDELDYEFEDFRETWAEIDKRKRGASTLDGADFVDRFDESLVTDDLFRSESETVRFEHTRASDGTGEIAQVSGETPVRVKRAGRYVSQGAVVGSGEVVVQIP